jgi:hypothetical protein
LVYLKIVLMLMQDRCTLCAECTIASEIILDAPNGTPRSIWTWCLYWCKIGAWFVQNVPHDEKPFWTNPMELLGDMGHVESQFSLFRDSVRVGTR